MAKYEERQGTKQLVRWQYRRPRLVDTGEKVRNVVALVYIEDLEKQGHSYYDLLSYLDHRHFKAVVSPLHDRDKFTEEDVSDWCERHIDKKTGDVREDCIDRAPYVGKEKKPHCHICILCKGPHPAVWFTNELRECVEIRPTMWEKLIDYDGFVRYCIHKDSPQKAQYSPFEVHSFGGADLSELVKADKQERLGTLRDVYRYVQERNIRSYHALLAAAMNSDDADFINCVCGRAAVWTGYFGSIRQERIMKATLKKAERASE